MRLTDLQQSKQRQAEDTIKFLVFDAKANHSTAQIKRFTGASDAKLIEANFGEDTYLLPLPRALDIALLCRDREATSRTIQVWMLSDDAKSTMARLADGFLLALEFSKSRISELEKMTHALAAIEQARNSLIDAEADMQMAKYCARTSPLSNKILLEDDTLTRSRARSYGRDAQEKITAWLVDVLHENW